MYIKDGIAYAEEQTPAICVSEVKPMDGHKLLLRFNTDEAKIVDFTPLLAFPAFAPLADRAVFDGVYLECGVTVWNDGEIDIDPAVLYERGVAVH